MANVLLIDDDRLARRMYGDFLVVAGHRVETAETGEEGLSMLEGEAFDVVVTDLLLPGCNGLEVLARARAIHPTVGVVVISALDVVDPAVRAIKSGAFDYLVKPIGPDALQRSVERCLELQALLQENTGLRGHLALAEAGARLANIEARAELWRQLVVDLVLQAGAHASLVVVRDEDERVQVSAQAHEGTFADWPEHSFGSELLEATDNATREVPVPAPAAPEPLAGEGVGMRIDDGVALVVHPAVDKPLDPETVRRTRYLLRNASHALASIERVEEAQSLAFVDDLTSLFNARYLSVILDRNVEKALAGGLPFSVLFLDLDAFKDINDQHGHVVGSEVLGEVANLIKASIRGSDVAVRYGGDEYVVVLPETDVDAAMRVAERARNTIANHTFLMRERKDLRLRLTVSVGVATCPVHARDRTTLIDLADQAMYRGKRAGRNVVYLAGAASDAEG